MTFVDLGFYPLIILLLLVLLILQRIIKSDKLYGQIKRILLLAFSLYLIYLYDIRFCWCIIAVIFITYLGAIIINGNQGRKRSIFSALVVLILIAFLGYFKYFNFFMETIYNFGHMKWNTCNIILPIGISFYIFSAISYVLDVTWKVIPVEYNILNIALFLAFFPKFICGPVVKGRDFIPQIKENNRLNFINFQWGIQVFIFGLFKKMVLADHIVIFVDDVFSSPLAFNTATVWLACFSNYLSLYFDFSGYSDMAIGISKILGYEILPNFNLPFVASNINEFWDRWHISLTSYLNEYLFNPLALYFRRRFIQRPQILKKFKLFPECAAMIIVFMVSGIWHGVGWTYLLWGVLHGIFSVLYQIYLSLKKEDKGAVWYSNIRKIISILLCYLLVNIIQVVFKAESIKDAFVFYKALFTVHQGIVQPYMWSFLGLFILFIATIMAYRKSKKNGTEHINGYYPIFNLNTITGLTIFFVVCGLILVMGYFGETYFVYGKF